MATKLTQQALRRNIVQVFSKKDCFLCTKLYDRLEEVQEDLGRTFDIETRDITTNQEWWNNYQFTIPVVHINGKYWRCEVTLDKFEKNYEDFLKQLNEEDQSK